MARENEFYRDTIALLNDLVPGTAVLTLKQTAEVLGYKNMDSVKKLGLGFVDGKLNKVKLAHYLCTLNR